ncbi:putative dsRNA-binding protein, partial [Gottfriedia acidiceleris]|uniref:putative dsRNA-binding protein n=1 Tax=Gottfriedia acidiceleris TaxID=371036 RepID=UPI0033970104
MIGERLKNQLKIDIDPQTLQEALYHSSYINEIRLTNIIEIQKSYIHMGKQIYLLALATIIAEEETMNNKGISEKLIQYKDDILGHFYDDNNLNELLLLGKGELNSRKERYLDHCLIIFYHIYKAVGFYRLRRILNLLYKKSMNIDKHIDYKSALQEHIQKMKLSSESIKYEIINVDGPQHNCYYTIMVKAIGLNGIGTANSKKKAQQQAAQNWFEKHKVDIPSKRINNSILSKKNQTMVLTNSREIELKQIYKKLHLSSKDISLKAIDICFTHKSFANEKKLSTMEMFSLYAWFGSKILPFVIGEFILQDFRSSANGKFSRLMELSSSMVSKQHLSISLPNSIFSSVKIPNKKDLNAPTLRADIVQTLAGAMFLQNLEHQNEEVLKNIMSFAQTFIISSFEKDSESLDYRSYLQIITQELKMETRAKIATSGPSHLSKHEVWVTTFFASGEKFLIGNGKASSKKQSVNLACKEIINQMKSLFHLNNSYLELPNKAILNQILAYFVRSAINNKNPLKFLELVGGLCLKKWSLNIARSIVSHLYSRGVISELLMLLIKWEKIYSREIVENCISQLSVKEREGVLTIWLETITKRDQLQKDYTKEVGEMEDEFLFLFKEFDFKPVRDPNYIVGNIGIRIPQIEEDKESLKSSHNQYE